MRSTRKKKKRKKKTATPKERPRRRFASLRYSLRMLLWSVLVIVGLAAAFYGLFALSSVQDRKLATPESETTPSPYEQNTPIIP